MFEDITPSSVTPVSEPKNIRMNKSAESRKKETKKKNYKFAIIIMSVILLIFLACTVLMLKVNSVNVYENNGIYTDDRIAEAAKPGKFRLTVGTDTDKIAQMIESELPYLDGITVETDMSTRSINITAVYTSPAFAVEAEEGYVLLNEKSKILEITSELPAKVPAVTGVKLDNPKAGATASFVDDKNNEKTDTPERLQTIISTLRIAGVKNVKEYVINSFRNIIVYLNDGGQLRLGEIESFSDMKTAYLAELYSRKTAEGITHAYVIEIKDSVNGYVRDLPEEVVTVEPLTDENGEPVTDENGEIIPADSVTEQPEETTTEEPATQPVTEPEETTGALSGLHSGNPNESTGEKTTEKTTQQSTTQEPAATQEEPTSGILSGLH